jgi:hypothetical protein
VDNCDTIVIDNDTDLKWITALSRTDEHGDVWVVGFESPPVVPEGVEHVVVCHTVLSGRRLDVHNLTLPTGIAAVNKC